MKGILGTIQTNRLRNPIKIETTASREQLLSYFRQITDADHRPKGWMSGRAACWSGVKQDGEDFRLINGVKSKKSNSISQYWAASIRIVESPDGVHRTLHLRVVFWKTHGHELYGKADMERLRTTLPRYLAEVDPGCVDRSDEETRARGRTIYPWTKR